MRAWLNELGWGWFFVRIEIRLVGLGWDGLGQDERWIKLSWDRLGRVGFGLVWSGSGAVRVGLIRISWLRVGSGLAVTVVSDKKITRYRVIQCVRGGSLYKGPLTTFWKPAKNRETACDLENG